MMVADSTNGTQFTEFIDMIVPWLRPNQPKPALILDNAAAHKTNVNKAKLEEHFNVLWMPATSC